MLNFIICDGNEKHNENMLLRLERIFKNNNIDGVITLVSTDPLEVIKYSSINYNTINVYILEINLKSNMTGIELAGRVRERDPQAYFIFATAHQEYTLLSLKLKTFDFLIKPISFEILEECIKRLYNDFIQIDYYISIKSGTKLHVLKRNDTIFCEKFGQILIIHTINSTIRCYETLESVESRVNSNFFFKCHKSYLINIKHISTINIKDNTISMSNGEVCLLSRNSKKKLMINVGYPK